MMQAEIRLGVLALTDSVPLVAAQALGYFKDAGLEVQLIAQPSWATLRDQLAIGSLDAAQMLAPMIPAISRGFAGGIQCQLKALLVLSRNGNGITVSGAVMHRLNSLQPGQTLGSLLRAELAQGRAPLSVGTVFPFSMHTLLLRRWLRSQDVDPDSDVQFRVVPPVRTVDAMRSGEIDLFCVGEPWNTVAQEAGLGEIVATSQSLWPQAPEKVLGCTQSWADSHPEQVDALTQSVARACDWLAESPDNRMAAAGWLASAEHVNVPVDLLKRALLPGTPGDLSRPAVIFDGRPVGAEPDPAWLEMERETLAMVRRGP